MSNGIVLNHHSLPFASIDEANSGLLRFFMILKKCRGIGLKILLVDEGQDKSLMRIELAKGYFVNNWLLNANRNASLRDWCRFLRSVETKQPLFETANVATVGDSVEVGRIDESSGKRVLLAAFHFNEFLISFSALESWLASHIHVWVLDVSEDVEEHESQLLNLVNENSMEVHGDELLRRRNALVSSAKEIWMKREELFPELSFLSNQIGTALQNWSAREDVLLKARDALNVLELFSSKWKGEEFLGYRHEYLRDLGLAAEVSGESASVNNHPKKKRERMFWLDDGREVYCENHIKLPDGYRLHFYSDASKKHIYVAYLGTHMTL